MKNKISHGVTYANLASSLLLLTACSSFGKDELNALPPLSPSSERTITFEKEDPVREELKTPRQLTLAECLEIALANNHERPISRYAIAIAEAQHRQALSAYWPQLSAKIGLARTDEPLNYIQPGLNYQLPASSFATPAMAFGPSQAAVTIPANAFGPGFPPQSVNLPVSTPAISVPGGSIPVPAQEINVPPIETVSVGRDIATGSLEANVLLYDGGKRKARARQAKYGIIEAKESARKTDLALIERVRRMYYSTVMSTRLLAIGTDTLIRMETTLNMTERMFKEGAGSVKKTDFLRNKVMVESIRSSVAQLQMNMELAQTGLIAAMGLPWDADISPITTEIPFQPYRMDLETLVSDAYSYSPDWGRLEAGLQALEAGLKKAKGNYKPQIGLQGSLNYFTSDGDAGLTTDQNERGWQIGLGIEIPLFAGFRNLAQVKAARAEIKAMHARKLMLRDGIGLQIKSVVIGLQAVLSRKQALETSLQAATENRELNERAYRDELVETADVIEAQIIEALTAAQFEKVIFDHATSQAALETIVGTEILSIIGR